MHTCDGFSTCSVWGFVPKGPFEGWGLGCGAVGHERCVPLLMSSVQMYRSTITPSKKPWEAPLAPYEASQIAYVVEFRGPFGIKCRMRSPEHDIRTDRSFLHHLETQTCTRIFSISGQIWMCEDSNLSNLQSEKQR